MAWIDYIHTVENYKTGSNIKHGAAAVGIGVVAEKTGSKEAGDLTAREMEEVTTSDDIKLAKQKLESVAMKYGVQ